MKRGVAYSTLLAAMASTVANAQQVVEEVEVFGTYFNDYKVDEASGAMRMPASLLETAQSVTVIPSTIMNEQLTTTLGEVLSNDASLTAGSQQRNREVFNLRGFELSSSTGYLRDGHQHWSHYQQPIEVLERVEVIKGPSSILYGQSGPGGLVNMVTKKPVAERFLDIGADVDEKGSSRVTLDAGGALNSAESLRYRGVLVKQDVDYWRDYPNGDERERDRFLGALVVDYDVTDNLQLRFHYDRTDDEAGLDTGGWLDSNGRVIGRDTDIHDFSWAFTDITVENYGADISWAFAENWSLTLGYNEQSFERQRFESSPRYSSDYRAGDSYTSSPYDRFDDWQFTTAFADVVGQFSTGGIEHRLLLGANTLDYYYGQLRTSADSVEYQPGQPEPLRPDVSYRTDDTLSRTEYDYYGVYVQDLVTLNDQWQVSLGGRMDKQSKEGADNESFVPKAGVLFHPNDQTTWYVSYSEGFEPQSSDTIIDETDINNGKSLDAVTSKQLELGAKWQLMDERLLLTAAVFDISKQGTLITEALEGDPLFDTRTTQAGEQVHQGIELGAQGAVTDRFFVMLSAMYLDATYERDANYENNTPVDAPEWSASLWTRYELNDSLAFNAGVFYEGDRFADNDNSIVKDGYTRFDAGATYRVAIADTMVNLRLNVENVFDTNYLGGGGNSNVTIGEGTNFRLAAQVSF